MATPRRGRGRNGTKKYGRNKVKCEIYRREHRREKNKIRKLSKLLKRHPNNLQILKTINKLKTLI